MNIRLPALAAVLAAGFSLPSVAADAVTAPDAQSVAAFTGQMAVIANQKEMRSMLAAQGYIITSDLNRDDSGRWVGTALKDGKVVPVAVKMPPRTLPVPLTN